MREKRGEFELYDLIARVVRGLGFDIGIEEECSSDESLGEVWYDGDDRRMHVHDAGKGIAEWVGREKADPQTAAHYNECVKVAKRACGRAIDDESLYALFVILHEIGHWHQQSNAPDVFNEQAKNRKKEIDKMKCEMQGLADFGVYPGIVYDTYACRYRQIPFEKYADMFAVEKISECLDLV